MLTPDDLEAISLGRARLGLASTGIVRIPRRGRRPKRRSRKNTRRDGGDPGYASGRGRKARQALTGWRGYFTGSAVHRTNAEFFVCTGR